MKQNSYTNATEVLVEQRVDKLMKLVDCCLCAQCRADVICIALNHLPVCYVSSHTGLLYSKLHALDQQMSADVTIQIVSAAQFVKAHPHHKNCKDLSSQTS